MRQPVEAVAADRVTALPFPRYRVYRGGAGDGGVEGGVEAGDGRERPALRGDRIERGQGLGLMQGGEVGQVPQLLAYVIIDQCRAGEDRSAVHDAVTGHVGLAPAIQKLAQPESVQSGGPGRQVGAPGDGVLVVEQAQLEARRAGVDDQYRHRQPRPGQVQPEIAGSSSPCSRV